MAPLILVSLPWQPDLQTASTNLTQKGGKDFQLVGQMKYIPDICRERGACKFYGRV